MPSQQRLDPQASFHPYPTTPNQSNTHTQLLYPTQVEQRQGAQFSAIIWDIRRTLLLDRRSKSEGLL